MRSTILDAIRPTWARAATVAATILGLTVMILTPSAACAGSAEPLVVSAGQSVVLEMPNEVSTVSIADPKVADAAVGSERSVVVNGKAAGHTSLVVWEERGRYTHYDVTVVDRRYKEQVLLEVKVSELNQQKMKEAGLDWTGMLRSAKHLDGTISGGLFVTKVESPFVPLIVGPTTDGFATWRRSDGGANFLTTMRLLEENGVARTLASPNLVATSGDSAVFLAGGEFPVPIARGVSEGSISVSIEWKEYGVRLKCIPTVLGDGRIRLYVAPEVSAPDYSRSVLLGGYQVPGVVSRRVATTVELGTGEVLVIGGVKHTEDIKTTKKVPILGDIPLLNILFKSKKSERIERDLVIVVSPSVLGDLSKNYPRLPTDLPPLPGGANGMKNEESK
jgi:pilus assembly protein CpaC